MRRICTCAAALAVLVSLPLVSGARAEDPDGLSRAEAIAVVQRIVSSGLQCAAPGWTSSGYAAEGGPDAWTVRAYASHAGASRISIDFTVVSESDVKPRSLLAGQVLKCAGGVTAPPVPKVRAFTKKGAVEPGETIGLEFAAKDETGKARVRLNVYQGGAFVKRWTRTVRATSLTHRHAAEVNLPATLEGPLFFCVWADNRKGGRSRNSPRSSCARIALEVSIKKVSNGCGGQGWDTVVAVENYFGNRSTYTDAATGRSYEVDFSAACNLHDAGYGGHTVRDELHGRKLVDFREWTRAQIDEKFRTDMILLCEKTIPEEATGARAACRANYRFGVVRRVGASFFDADVMEAGQQSEGPRA